MFNSVRRTLEIATAFFVMGADEALEFCRHRSDLAALLVTPGRRGASMDLHAAGMENGDWRRIDGA